MTNTTNENALRELLQAVAETGYAFVPPTPETHRRVNARSGNEQARDLRDIFGWNRPFSAQTAGTRIHDLLTKADALDAVGDLWKSRVRIATLNGLHYLHSAFPTIDADAVFFGPDTYRFVRGALAILPHRAYRRAVDIGCGSGAGGLAIAVKREIGQLWLSDINPRALVFGRVNALQANQPASCIESNLFAALEGDFDLILANPPYLADSAKRVYRDGGGALGMDLGLRIVREGVSRLSPGGVLFLYTGVPIMSGADPFRAAILQFVQSSRYSVDYSEIDPDVFGEELDAPAYRCADRIAAISLIIQRTGE